MCTSFKTELLDGVHAFGTTVVRPSTTPDTFKIALYTSFAAINASTTGYTTEGEISDGGYVAGGIDLVVNPDPTYTGTTAYLSFDDAVWTSVSFTARAALIYNSTQGNKSVAILDFGSDKVAGPNFIVQFPTANSSNAIIRIS